MISDGTDKVADNYRNIFLLKLKLSGNFIGTCFFNLKKFFFYQSYILRKTNISEFSKFLADIY